MPETKVELAGDGEVTSKEEIIKVTEQSKVKDYKGHDQGEGKGSKVFP